MIETKKSGKTGKTNSNPPQELHSTNLYGVTVTARSKEELARKLSDMRESCR